MIPELSETVRVSRDKYPDTSLDTRIDGLVQEAGEALQALMKLKMGFGTREHAREEVLHLAGQCVRILEESLNYPEIPEGSILLEAIRGCPHWHGGECQDHAEIILTEEDVAEMQAQVEADKALLAKAEAEMDAYREEVDYLRIRLDRTTASRDEINKCALENNKRFLTAREDGIAMGVKWASAHPRIHRWDYQEPVTAYIERGVLEVGGGQ